MQVRFSWVATAFAVWLWIVVACWALVPSLVLQVWALPVDDAGISLGLRVAALCLGWSVILFLARNEPPSRARRAISFGSTAGNIAAAAGGIWSLATGIAGVWILFPVVVELLVATAFILAERVPLAPQAADATAGAARAR
jgi:hypothetical protein